MKIAYNSAYIQIETFTFTFDQQIIIVCLSLFQVPRNRYAERQILMYKPIIFCQKMSDCRLH